MNHANLSYYQLKQVAYHPFPQLKNWYLADDGSVDLTDRSSDLFVLPVLPELILLKYGNSFTSKSSSIPKTLSSQPFKRSDQSAVLHLNMVRINGGSFHMGDNSDLACLGDEKSINTENAESLLGLEIVRIKGDSIKKNNVSSFECQGDENLLHTVKVKSFYICATEVTFNQWDACVVAGACSYKPDGRGWGRGNRPVINISWNDTQIFITWLRKATGKAYRLPTEAEWEYAARGGTTTKYPWGNEIDSNKANCNGCDSQWDRKTAPVGSFSAYNGLYDMHGNVWEWVQDCYHKSYHHAPTNGEAWQKNCFSYGGKKIPAVLRGGSWFGSPTSLRSADRIISLPNKRTSSYGFRVVRID